MKHFIFITLILAITISAICVVFYLVPESNGAWAAVIGIAVLGCFTAIFEYLTYKENKKVTRWHD
jgi:RsiW-degrading membrane proteinase PrsW (M82 family)